MLNDIQKQILAEVADLHGVPEGAYNFRVNGDSAGRSSTANIEIVSKTDLPGIDIIIKPGTKNESVHIPVVLSGSQDSQHDGIHRFHVGRGARVKYVEKHYGEGDGRAKRILNPVTEVEMAEDSWAEMEMVQIKGVDSTVRKTKATLAAGATLLVRERLMTHGDQVAESVYETELNGEGSSADVVSRSVARDRSVQRFESRLTGNARCSGHTSCDAIIMDDAKVLAVPALDAMCVDAALIHEAAIGKIAGEQLVKLMTLGLTEEEAEEKIVSGFRSGSGSRNPPT